MAAGTPGALALTPEDLKPLAEDDFDAKAQALDRIIAASDEVALRLLEAMDKENLVATSDEKVLIQEGSVFKDPITEAPVTVAASDVQPITLNNALRPRL